MCGFLFSVGECDTRQRAQLAAAAPLLKHRGPDACGVLEGKNFRATFFRLSISDPLARSDQPMADPSGRFVLAFNGEIYNHHELRLAMARTGPVFRTSGDTEVVLQGLVREGVNFVSRLEGMFAFVFWDSVAGTLIAARDPFGIKPLYYVSDRDHLVFASEPRPLRFLAGTRVTMESIAELIVFRHASGGSLFEGIHSVEAGHVLHGRPNLLGKHVFADPAASLLQEPESERPLDLPAAVHAGLKESISSHIRGLGKVALQLSGGVDSSLIATLCAAEEHVVVEAYGLSIEGIEHDESPAQAFVASQCGIQYVRIPFTQSDFAERFPECISALDAPSPHYGCVALDLLCSIAAQSHKTMLVGEGADELFGGYSRYVRRNEFVHVSESTADRHPHPPNSILFATAYAGVRTFEALFPSLDFGFPRRSQVVQHYTGVLPQLIALDIKCYLPSLLMRQDRVSMAHGIEARTPYLHLPLLNLLSRNGLTSRMPAVSGITKPILKKVADSFLPAWLVHRRKNGLTLPIREWLRSPGPMRDLLSTLTDGDARLGNFADTRQLRKAVDGFLGNRIEAIDAAVLMQILNVELWLRIVDDWPRPKL